VLDQHLDGHLVGQPDVRAREPSLGDLPAQHLYVVGHPCREPVPEFLVRVEPLQFVMRAGRLECGLCDLRDARQRGGGARLGQPRPAPHQRYQEQLGHRIQIQREQRALTVGLRAAVGLRDAVGGRGLGWPPVPSGNGHGQLEAVVEHGARTDRRGSGVHQPAAGRLPFAFGAGQPDPVAVARDVERVRPAHIRDPRALRGRGDDPGPAGQARAGRDRQVHIRPAPED